MTISEAMRIADQNQGHTMDPVKVFDACSWLRAEVLKLQGENACLLQALNALQTNARDAGVL